MDKIQFIKRNIKKITIGLFVLLAFFGFWVYQKNNFSKDILKLEILGPREVTMGDKVEYTVRYKNNGQTTLENAKLVFEFPENSIPEGTSLQRIEQEIDDIYPGAEKTIKFQTRFLGKENEIKELKSTIIFKPKNLNATYRSETSFTTTINFVPLTLEFDLPSKLESGRDLSFSINYFSNSNWPLSNIGIKADYPSAFEFVSSQPKSPDKNEWQFSVLNKAQGGRINVSGRVFGEAFEQQIFKVQIGIWLNGDFITLKETTKVVEIIKPSLYISQKINDSSDFVATPGDLMHYEIFFKNVGDESFQNLFAVTRLEGDAYDLDTLKTTEGEFKQGDKSIIWDSRKVSKLSFLGAGEETKLEFWVNLKKEWAIPGPSDKNPTIKNEVVLDQAREEFVTKINSKMDLYQDLRYNQNSSFENTGSNPPTVGKPTTYTIYWQAKNYYNDVKNIKVKANLPTNIALTGEIFPKESRLAFDLSSREVVWEIGDLPANTGISTVGPFVNFQIKIIPNASQRGSAAKLVDNIRIIGEDIWTGQTVEIKLPTLDTSLNGTQGIIK